MSATIESLAAELREGKVVTVTAEFWATHKGAILTAASSKSAEYSHITSITELANGDLELQIIDFFAPKHPTALDMILAAEKFYPPTN